MQQFPLTTALVIARKKKENRSENNPLLQRMYRIIKVANWLHITLIVTADVIPRIGNVSDEVKEILPPDPRILNRMTFGLAAQPDILEAVRRTQRKTAVLIGHETDVCIAHSALGLMDLDYREVVLADATGSPSSVHQIGIERIRHAGGIILSAKSLYYEWVRTVERVLDFENSGIETPEGIVL